MNHDWIKALLIPLLAAALVACPVKDPPNVNDKITGIEASATPASIGSGATSSLVATVSGTGTFNTAVNWSVSLGGGSLSSSTGSSVTYTAPSVTTSTNVQIKATAAGDSSVSKTLLITVQPSTPTPSKPTINAFSATPTSLTAAGQVTLIWDVNDATSLSIDSGVGAVTGTSKVVSITSSTAFTLTATNASGSSTKTLDVTVASLPTPPTVVSVSPANGATGVSADAKIVVTFSKPMDQVATQAAYQSADLPASGVTFDWDASGTVLTVKPNAPLVYAAGTDPKVLVATAYAFSITSTAKDKSGIALVPLNSSFKTLRKITATLESEAVRDGNVESSGSFDITSQNIFAGDFTDNTGTRSFLSFDLSGVPSSLTSTSLERATLNIFKRGVSFDPYIDLHYPCTPACLTTRVVLDHVSYGESLEGADFNMPALSSGFIDGLSVPIGYITADMLTAVRDDITNRITRENRSQYRLSLPLISDGDGNPDFVYYGARDGAPQYRPSLILEYKIP
jgi:Bacterial Ig-like domain